ncbi:dynamin family protein [Alicyclobacillus kakegawensis]|uniref:dynamin family protein n=1 Tax=Alicyclobacillus kakegawensis TaxID=392012 RepID=UPI000834184C|nr:dynamin family protein [Alicyclobacillus kakegawensis]
MREIHNSTRSAPDTTVDGLRRMVASLAERLSRLPYTEGWRRELADLEGRLLREEQLVAVFGAFSTGKSSLINAVLGEPVLVVSPNPTTAAITELRFAPASGQDARPQGGGLVAGEPGAPSPAVPAPADAEGGTVARVEAKTEAQMWDDVSLALAALQRQADGLAGAAELAKSLKPKDVPSGRRKTLSFLKAFAAGYEELADRLGRTWTLPAADASRLCAEERYACFVQRVQLWHPSASLAGRLPRGLVWVDTPGVDSVHRRHTDVAFQYMRLADAIVFVLYYTHALSRAEKDFLLQLAEVQDLVGADKLFVVINAVDLAQSEEERQAVRERVLEELRQLGIRQPRIYEVSSQLAYAARQLQRQPDNPAIVELLRTRLGESAPPDAPALLEQSGVPTLERDLSGFLTTQAREMAVDAVVRTLRSLESRVAARIEQVRAAEAASEHDRQELAARRRAIWEEMERMGEALDAGQDEPSRRLRQEAQELVFHAGERIRFRFTQLFREAFYPGRFQGLTRASDALQAALQELVESLRRQVEMECRTLALRLGTYAEQLYTRERAALARDLEAVGRADVADGLPDAALVSLADQAYRSRLDAEPLIPYLKGFQSAKSFFEGGGQDAMRQGMAEAAADAVREDLANLTGPMTDAAVLALQRQYRALVAAVLNSPCTADDSRAEREPLEAWEGLADDLRRALAAQLAAHA